MTHFGHSTAIRWAAFVGLFAFLVVPALHDAGLHHHEDCPTSVPTCVDTGTSEQLSPGDTESCPLCLLARQGRSLVPSTQTVGASAPVVVCHSVPQEAEGRLPGLLRLAHAAPRAPPLSS